MRAEILKQLKEHNPVPLSGEVLARKFGVSRTTVWKSIRLLQQEGYLIAGSPRRGYVLRQTPDILYPHELGEKITTSLIAPNPDFIHHYESIPSTNDLLKEMAEEGAPEGTVVIAEKQSKGRGRVGREWSSPAGGGIYLSLLLRPPLPPQSASSLTLLAAVAVCTGIKETVGKLESWKAGKENSKSPGIKWPNDILIGGRKVCGILCELKAEMDMVHYLVAGIGINVNTTMEDFPSDLRTTATSLKLENSGRKVSRLEVAAAVLQCYDKLYRAYLEQGAAPVLTLWTEHNITLGQKIKIQNPAFSYTGIARELDNNGALVVEGVNGEVKDFAAGEVIFIESQNSNVER